MTPEEQEAVRRALAATPPVGPMPPEVVARLEATITALAASRGAGVTDRADGVESSAAVIDLEERRRRRWPRVLVAAASVAVLAYGVGAVVQDLGPQSETAATDAAGGSAVDEGSAEQGSGGELGPAVAPEAAEPEEDRSGVLAGTVDAPVVELRRATLRRDVADHLGDRTLANSATARDSGRPYSRRDGTCVLPEVNSGDAIVPARLDGHRATLVVRPARAGSRVAEVYSCDDGRTLLARTVVPARR